MPPKKNKAQVSSAKSQQIRRRKNSNASSISEAPSVLSQQSTVTSVKRTKRTLRSKTEHEHEMLEEVVEAMDEEEVETEEQVKLTNGDMSIDSPLQPPLQAKRAASGSPAEDIVEPPTKRIKHTTVRRSLPAALSQDINEQIYVEETEFAPLSEVLKQRVEQRARIHALQLDLEVQKKLKASKRVQEIENELAQLENAAGDDTEHLDETMLVLASQQHKSYPELHRDEAMSDFDLDFGTDAPNQQQALSQSTARSYESMWATERKQFQDAILSLSREATEAKAKLQTLEIELQGLGFADDAVDAESVLFSIRTSFAQVRLTLHASLPGQPLDEISNEGVVDVLTSNIKDFAERLKTQHRELEDKDKLAAELGNQIRSLIDHLADRELRIKQLEERWTELDRVNEEKIRTIEELQEELEDVTSQRDNVDEELSAKVMEADTLANENAEYATSVERLTTSLKSYQEEEVRLQQLISRMETDHKETLSKMNQEREETIREFEDQLDKLSQLHNEAQATADRRQITIESLEVEIEDKDEAMRGLKDQIDELSARRNAAESEIQDKELMVEELEARVDRLDNELTALRSELEELRSLNEEERAQHEVTQDKVDELNAKLLDQGKLSNELKQKLFEAQQAREKKVEELEQLASERDEQYQDDIAKEVDRRELAEELSQQQAAIITDREARIEEVEASLAERDDRIEQLEEEIVDKDDRIATLEQDLSAARERYETYLVDFAAQKKELDDAIATLKITLVQRETEITHLQDEATVTADLHDGDMEDKNSQIAELKLDVTELKDQVTLLEADKLSLERRVETEAEQMLELQSEKQDEIESLKDTIRDKQAKIRTVEEKAVEADQRWQEVLTAREAEIAELRETGEEKTERVATLTTELQSVRARFSEYILKTSARMRDMKAQLHAAVEEADATMDDGGAMLEELEAMGGDPLVIQETITTKQTKKTRGRKKRVKDSGIGLEEDDEMWVS